ncbi:hypothetical protein FisN_18Lh237 [Fistulifera solaris]|uniref:Calpain catalytic domain-containing protein n=1 Tax=Fistulifera solaris TaxID=1519565 RepID=A0A1Z5JU71_FISSO|nr:hypothetical protein FisN_18Lh237 [Fistulifera solaris]|eukprot:GAX17585.1 hypothetical protein FisN_18Lh237 [Fistulifera solaris]
MGNCRSEPKVEPQEAPQESSLPENEVKISPPPDASANRDDSEASSASSASVSSSSVASSSASSSATPTAKCRPYSSKKTKAVDTPEESSAMVASSSPSSPPPHPNEIPSKWKVTSLTFNGSVLAESIGTTQEKKGDIKEAIADFHANPRQYISLQYQTAMLDWPVKQQQYKIVHREGTAYYTPQDVSPDGWMTCWMQHYQALPALPNDELPPAARDQYTDTVLATHFARKLPKPLLPGRGMGCCDDPKLKIIGNVDPSDIKQGTVGDCWLLSGISSLAEFDGAIKKLFRKSKDWHKMPGEKPNMYTITLWDLPTWTEVDIVVDERLCANPNKTGLLSSKPSSDGELWVCYLEKAIAAHCGGWDKITGGHATHAWALMTGCKEQYTIFHNPKTDLYYCSSRYDPNKKKWSAYTNAPSDSYAGVWPGAWPKEGGGGKGELPLEEVFQRMCAWDKINFIMGAGRSNDVKKEAGMVDNHGYSVIECRTNVAGTGVDMVKVRNPWGKGEMENGEFDDDGPGWEKYPKIKQELNPVVADDGIFWVTKEEFFRLYDTIYVSAKSMTEFLED